MRTFEYKGLTTAGSTRRGMIEAQSPKAAREQLAQSGILVERLSVSGARTKSVSSEMRAVMYRELAALLAAGTPLVVSLDTLIATPEMRALGGVLGTVRDRVREGGSFSQSLAETPLAGSRFELATIEVAERTATLEAVLEQLADFIDAHERTRERIQHALIYPALVLGLGVCVAIAMLGFLVPRTREMMGSAAVNMPLLTRIMLAIGDHVWPWGIVIIGLLSLGGFLWHRHVSLNESLCVRRDMKRFRIPVVGRGYALLVSARFAKTLSILVRSGVSLVDAMGLAGRATGSPWVAQLSESESDSLRHGSTLADAVRKIEPFSEILPGWIEIGEASGRLSELLNRAAERAQVRWDRFLSRLLVLLEPALLLLVGGFVLLIALSVLLPVFTLTNSIVGK